MSSGLLSRGWGQPHRRNSSTEFSSPETSQLCLGLQTRLPEAPCKLLQLLAEQLEVCNQPCSSSEHPFVSLE